MRITAGRTRATQLARALSVSHYALPGAGRPGAWRIETAALVVSPTPPVPGLIQLGLVDTELYMVGGPCNGAMFFTAALDSERLQQALAQSLEAFPILAGRVVSLPPPGQPHRSNRGQWRRGFPRAVECNNAGAVRPPPSRTQCPHVGRACDALLPSHQGFTVLSCPHVQLPRDRGSGDRLPPFPAMEQFKHLYEMTDSPADHILDVLQVKFNTGCMLVVSASHAILDGASMAMFVSHFAALTNGVPAHTLPTPVLDRLTYDYACAVSGQVAKEQWSTSRGGDDAHDDTMFTCCFAPLAARRGSHFSGGGMPGKMLTEMDGGDEASPPDTPHSAVSSSASEGDDCDIPVKMHLPAVSPLGGMVIWPPKLTMARILLRAATDSSLGLASGSAQPVRMLLRLSADTLRRMKAAAVAEARATGLSAEAASALSSNDLYCALLWRAVAASRKRRGVLDRVGDEESFAFVANTRHLVLPREQQMFVGNATAVIECRLSGSDLVHKSMAHAALAMRAAKMRLTADAVRGEMAFLQAHADTNKANVMWNTAPVDGRTLLWDWTKFPLFSLSFCGSNKPFWFEPGLGAPRLLPHIFGAAPEPTGDGLLVFANVPADEADDLAAAVRVAQAQNGEATEAGVDTAPPVAGRLRAELSVA